MALQYAAVIELSLLSIAVKYNIDSMKEKYSKALKTRPKCCFSLSEFFNISPKAMSYIVQQNAMNIESEIELFLAVVRWAEHYLRLKNYKCLKTPAKDPPEPVVDMKHSVPYGLASIENEVLKIDSISVAEYSKHKLVGEKTIVYPKSIPANDNMLTEVLLTHLSDSSKEYGLMLREFLVDTNILKHIRFLTMGPSQFCQHVLHRNILTIEEIGYIMMYLNASVLSTPAPETLCHITTPREEFDPDLTIDRERICTVTLTLRFLIPHYLEVKKYTQFKEYFYCSSEKPICLESVIIPPKRSKSNSSVSYDEDMTIRLGIVNEDRTRGTVIATSHFRGKWNYGTFREFKFVYNINDFGTELKKGMHFSIQVITSTTGSHLGGVLYSPRCIDNDFIQVSKGKQRGIVHKITFSFLV